MSTTKPKHHSSNGAHSQPKSQTIGTQTEIISMNYIPPNVLSSFQLESEAFPSFFYKPHMVALLVFLCGLITYAAFFYTQVFSDTSFITNARVGLLVAFGALIYYGALYFPSSLMQRPHYSFWRMILGISICYCCTIIFILFQTKEDLNFFFKTFFDQKLGKPLPEKSYAEDCRLYTPDHPTSSFANLGDSFDMFIAAHFFGWFFKMLMVRDWKFTMFLSVFFEFLEITFKHWLPNFQECWWDSLILDVLLCNALGIYAGHLFIKRFQMKSFKWTKNMEVNKKSIFGNFYDFVRSTPIDKRDWHVFSDSKRFISVIYYMALMYAVDLSNFFNKYVLWLPASHYLLSIRIFLWGFLSLACTREYYEYISNNMFMRVGPFLFVGHMILFVEFSILVKFSWGTDYFSEPFPRYVVWSWAIICLVLVTITLVLFYRDVKNKLKERNGNGVTHKVKGE